MTRFGSGSVMVWGGISLGGRTALHVLARGSLTAIRYRDEILRPLVRPYAGAVGPGFLLMQDNARPHVAGVCQQFLQDEGIDAMDWPARSPDLNPIEHIWDIMSRSIHQHHVAPQTVTGVGGCFSPGLGGDPSGDHPPPHQEHAQAFVKMEEMEEYEMKEFTESSVLNMNENELRGVIKHFLSQSESEEKRLQKVREDKIKESKLVRSILEENRLLKVDLHQVRKQLETRKEQYKIRKEEQQHFFKQQEQLHQVTLERDFLKKECSHFKEECKKLKKNTTYLKAALTSSEKENHALKREVEDLQKQLSTLKSSVLIDRHYMAELAQSEKALVREKQKYSDLERKLSVVEQKPHQCPPPKIVVNIPLDTPSNTVRVFRENQGLKDKHLTMCQDITTKRRQLEKKDCKLKEKEKECEELRHNLSRMVPPEKDLITKYEWDNRKQSKIIKQLKAEVASFQKTAENYKSENEKLVKKEAAVRKMYLDDRMVNLKLREALKERGATVPVIKSSIDESKGIQVPHSGANKDKKLQTLKSNLAFSSLPNKMQLEPGAKSVEKSDLLQSHYSPLPAITSKAQVGPDVKSVHPQTPPKTEKLKSNPFPKPKNLLRNVPLPPINKELQLQPEVQQIHLQAPPKIVKLKSDQTPQPKGKRNCGKNVPLPSESSQGRSTTRQTKIFMTEAAEKR
ncbi:hypothetical protein L3Q82_024250 [Scortum barcoo]|uniref:Uncharacterized protein n=1 Tax=Scortum barcoo TaxID=214431 RepID=A0ACB8WV54_9TELE|nr:hypothetical protein L3Q82_024250 [Scortum barcoo]